MLFGKIESASTKTDQKPAQTNENIETGKKN
jgi:hypothetical protein